MIICKVNRAELVQTLDAVSAGLAKREIIQQSASFIFRNGWVRTYNEETACKAKSPFPKEVTVAVAHDRLVRILNKMPEDMVRVKFKGSKMTVLGKHRGADFTIDSNIVLDVDAVEKPKTWIEVPQDFAEAITLVQECVSKDQSATAISCVHFHPKWIEACDGLQLTRYKIRLKTQEPFLVKKDGLKFVPALGVTKMALTTSWVHFRNNAGVTLSCRRYDEAFPSLKELLSVENAEQATLPKGIASAAKAAEDFSGENKDDNHVIVTLKAGQINVTGIGVSGKYWESKKLRYSGRPLSFLISPKLLIEITQRHDRIQLSEDRLLVNGGRWKYVTALGDPKEVEKQAEQEMTEDENEEQD